MLPERVSHQIDRVWMVAHWKWELDESTPWYRRFFFKYVFRPFIHFSWNVMKVPCPKGVEINGNQQRFIWFENAGFFSSEDQAEIACLNKWYGYKDVPLDRGFPPESAQYSSLVFPRQKEARQHRGFPTFSFILKERKKEELQQQTLAEYIKQLHQVLDR